MKPINLKIKGLNSFIEMQEINFEKLTDKGLFGIFGPTGSGKSTILDGITLALYGEVSRKSSNFMNINCDSLNVSYEFQITEKDIKRYRVDREFRRDNKTLSVRSKFAKVVDITNVREEVLEEGIKQVTQKCEEIIGLKLEDFTRTVVLPQGKFSEFLKLEGKDRRNMLERLFNLQKYGDDLSFKLGNKIKVERQKFDLLEGELKSYEEISDEILKEKTTSLDETKKEWKKCLDDLNAAEKNFSEGKELWGLQLELKESLDKLQKLKESENAINEIKRKAELSNSALKVKPYIDSYENMLQQINLLNKELVSLKENIDRVKIEKEENSKLLELTQNKKENEIPLLKIKEQKVLDAIEEKSILNKLIEEKNLLQDSIDKLNEKLEIINNDLAINNGNIELLKSNINEHEIKIETLKYDELFKKKINEGIILLNKYNSIVEQREKLNKEMKKVISNIDDAQKNSEIFSEKLKNINISLEKKEDEIKKLIENNPGDQNTLLNLQQKIAVMKEKWDRYKEYTSFIKSSNKNISINREQLKIYEDEKKIVEDSLNNINAEIKKIERENIAVTLRETLAEGNACPVCGSKEHHVNNIDIIDLSELDNLKIKLKNKEEKTDDLVVKINKLQANIETDGFNIKDREEKCKELGEEFKLYSVEELQKDFNILKNSINIFNEQKIKLEKNIKELNEEQSNANIEYNNTNSKLMHNREYLNKLQDDLKVIDEDFDRINGELLSLKNELFIEDFKAKSEEIFEKEKEREKLEISIKEKREDLRKYQELKDNLNEKLVSIKEELKVKNTLIDEKNQGIENKRISIKNKAGDAEEDLEDLKCTIAYTIEKIEDEYEGIFKLNKEIEKQYNGYNDKIISVQGNLNSLNNRVVKDREAIADILVEEGLKDIKEAKDNFILKSEIDEMLSKIEKYKSEINKLMGSIEGINNKINNRNLTEEEWKNVQFIKDEKARELDILIKSNIKLEEEVKSISKKLVYKKKLLDNKNQLDRKLGILIDLEKLFKGKKFVEFVAMNQLKYVSIEASKRLKEITSGQYGLDVDENGKFLIRDYKNGGIERDASTLSGGETFIASLSLALALSAQIQLKGTAPLELFFLDEGFGTLDDNLMEIVMDSLEKIHNNKLSIGIISHVEAIKSRVPAKLIVTPAISGMGGSKVRISD